MTTLQKLHNYKERLKVWKSDLKPVGVPEPAPKDFHLNGEAERFMAKKAREEVLGR